MTERSLGLTNKTISYVSTFFYLYSKGVNVEQHFSESVTKRSEKKNSNKFRICFTYKPISLEG